jgi:hypothetical protein
MPRAVLDRRELRFLLQKKMIATRRVSTAIPPTTPPAIAPVGSELPESLKFGEGDVATGIAASFCDVASAVKAVTAMPFENDVIVSSPSTPAVESLFTVLVTVAVSELLVDVESLEVSEGNCCLMSAPWWADADDTHLD